MLEQITVPQWVSVSPEVRNKLREIFKIPKTSSSQVEKDSMGNSRVISDGCNQNDLQALTVEKMLDFLGSAPANENVHGLFKMVVERVETSLIIAHEKEPHQQPVIAPQNGLKCSFCSFETASKFAMRMHIGKKHK